MISARSDLEASKTEWGSNAEFYYPKTGGIGAVWQKMVQSYGNKIKFKNEVTAIDIGNKKVYLKTGEIIDYEYLISTMPLDILLRGLLPLAVIITFGKKAKA